MYRIYQLFSILIFIVSVQVGNSQDYSRDDRVLFTIDNIPVTVSEFDYIYNKNNAANADYSEQTLNEYLDLYTKFKLKVRKALELKMDTIPDLQRELAGYRRQLAESYLMDKEVKNRLIEEAYKREQKEIHVSHILIRMGNNPKPKDTLNAYRRIMIVRDQIEKGMPFAEAAASFSEDRTAKENGGDMGFTTATLPGGYYALESAIYNLDTNSVSMPVQSPRGYHILKKHGERAAQGEVEIAHIFVKKGKSPQAKQAARARINKLYSLLQSGQKFETVAQTNSDDKATANKGGYIGYIRTGQFDPDFEALAYSLSYDESYSGPFESANGFHIVRRISRKELLPLAQERRRIENEIAKTERLDIAKKQLIERIKEESNYTLNRKVYTRFISKLDTSFFLYQWKAPTVSGDPILTIGEATYTDSDFVRYLQQNKRPRMQMANRIQVKAGAERMLNNYINDMCLKYEEFNLEKKYPDFKSLMREYKEGILLFELTKEKVWDRASKDTVGLENFYDQNKKKYMWENRALVQTYTIDSANMDVINGMYSMAAKKPAKKLLKKYGKKGLNIDVQSAKYEQKIADTKYLPWEEKYRTPLEKNEKTGQYSFMQIEKILDPEPKSLNDARGYIIADYQDYLESQWIADLKTQYSVVLDDSVYNSLIKE